MGEQDRFSAKSALSKRRQLPPYSVLMAVYVKDNAAWFREAIQSMIDQTWPPSEIVLVEDGSITTELRAVEEEFNDLYPGLIRRVSLPKNVGLAEALKTGIQATENEWVARMDADDISASSRCEEELRLALQNQADLVSCNYVEFQDTIEHATAFRKLPSDHEKLVRLSRRRSPMCHGAVMMKKSKVIQAGNYRRKYIMEDYDLFVRMLMSGVKCCNVNQFLYFQRAGDGYYARRGGWKYVRSAIRQNAWIMKQGWSSPLDFFLRSSGTAVVGLAPNQVRTWIYKRFLRNESEGRERD